jgi:Flp pilus assembly CpaF family ATPase
VRARLHGFGLLDQLLADPTIENLHANGCDRVFITRAGGRREQGPQLAPTDGDLVELIRRVAAHGGRTERRFDDARPLLNLRPPDGSRLPRDAGVRAAEPQRAPPPPHRDRPR